jgi:hypothetical protein
LPILLIPRAYKNPIPPFPLPLHELVEELAMVILFLVEERDEVSVIKTAPSSSMLTVTG